MEYFSMVIMWRKSIFKDFKLFDDFLIKPKSYICYQNNNTYIQISYTNIKN
jgi:hypothetical protein